MTLALRLSLPSPVSVSDLKSDMTGSFCVIDMIVRDP